MNGKKANTINRYKYFHHVNHQKIQQSSKKTLWASLIITLLFTVIEFVGGLVSNSLASLIITLLFTVIEFVGGL
ncbi:TPA: hypothetical protein ACWRSG_002011, partial [Staphylococcus aureus]